MMMERKIDVKSRTPSGRQAHRQVREKKEREECREDEHEEHRA